MNCGWNDRIEAIVDRLLKHTIANNLDWRAGKATAEFYALIGNNVVLIENKQWSPEFILHVYDGVCGELIGSTSPDIFANDKKVIPKLTKLYELARRKAMNAGRRLQNLLDFLKKEHPDEDKT